MTKDLFKDFDPVSAKAWKQKIQVDLKGADYNDTLIYKSHHGIDVKPFYHREDTKLVSVKAVSSWDVCEKIYIENVEKSITRANNVLTRGAEMLWFVIPNDSVNVKAILDKLNIGDKFIYIECTFLSEVFIKNLKDLQQSYNLKIGVDVIGHLAKDGNWFTNKDEDHSVLNKCIGKDILSIDAALYQNAGANIPQELAYTLAHINEYANHFTDQKDLNFTVKVSIGSNYFFEIAKLRALRLLFSTLAKEYNLNDNLFEFQLLEKGNLLENLQVTVFSRDKKNSYREIVKTNLNGVGKIRVIKNRTYLLSSVKLEKANYVEKLKHKSDWFSYWASLTFKN